MVEIIIILCVISLIAGIFYAIRLSEYALFGGQLPNIAGNPTNISKIACIPHLNDDLKAMHFDDEDGRDQVLYNLSEDKDNYKIYHIGEDINDEYKKGSLILIKLNNELNISFDKIPTGAFIINPVQEYCIDTILNKVWHSVTFDNSNISEPEIRNILLASAYTVLEHPKFQKIRKQPNYPGDNIIISKFQIEISNYIKTYFSRGVVNKYDRIVYITTNINSKNNWFLNLYTATNYIGQAAYYFTRNN